jgi:hypothetical protein
MNHDDLAAVREFRADLDEPRDGALARGRWRLASSGDGGGAERPRQRRTWLLATAGAALAVAVAVGGGAAVVHTATPQHKDPVVPQQSVSPSPSPVGDLPVTQGTRAPMHPQVVGQAGGSHAAAIDTMTRLAARQDAGPLPIGPGQVLYVKSYNLDDGDNQYLHEIWWEPSTGVGLRVRRAGQPHGIDLSLTVAEIAADTARSQAAAPGFHNLNGAYVAAFPSGAGQAHALSAQWRTFAAREYPGRAADSLIWDQVREVFHHVDPQLTSAQRAALYLALLDLPGAKATTATIAGRPYDVVCHARNPASSGCLLFDPASGRFAGDATTGADLVVDADSFSFVDVGVQPRPVPGTRLVITESDAPPVSPKR